MNLVMGPAVRGTAIPFRVLPRRPAGDRRARHRRRCRRQRHGVASSALYQLIRQPAPITERVFEIEFLDPGVELFCFTFG